MKYIFLFIFSIIIQIGFGQIHFKTEDCKLEKGYKKSTFRKYRNLKSIDFKSTYYNEKGMMCYKKHPLRKVTGYFGTWNGLEYIKRGRRSGTIRFYDECGLKVKEVHKFFPKRKDGKTTHLFFYENGRKQKKKIDRNSKPTKVLTWDSNGKKLIDELSKPGRYY